MPSYKIIYFNGKGRAELSRLILTAAGEKFEDSRIDFGTWGTLKPNTPWGGVPILEVDGKQLAQSNTMARYLARKFKLNGSGDWEEALNDSALDATEDIFSCVSKVMKSAPAVKEEETRKLREEVLPKSFAAFEKYISQNGQNGHVVGKSGLSLADIALYNIIDQLITHKHFSEGDLDKYPKSKEVYEQVRNHQKLADYIKNRPPTPF